MDEYPIEHEVVRGQPLDFIMRSERSHLWYGLRGALRNNNGDMKKALAYFANWNDYLMKMIRPGDTVIDVGANEGWTTCVFAMAVGPGGRVIAIEPVAANFRAVLENVELNRLANVTAINAVASEKIDAEYYMAGEVMSLTQGGAKVRSITLDSLNVKPDVIKIDVEGFELPVLRGAERILASFHPRLEVEMHLHKNGPNMKRFGYDPNDVYELLRRHGYQVKVCGKIFDRDKQEYCGHIHCEHIVS